MSLAHAAVEWPQVVTAVIAVEAFGLSVLSLLLKRRSAYLEGHFLLVRQHAAVTILYSLRRRKQSGWWAT
jgi:hypothetical protein